MYFLRLPPNNWKKKNFTEEYKIKYGVENAGNKIILDLNEFANSPNVKVAAKEKAKVLLSTMEGVSCYMVKEKLKELVLNSYYFVEICRSK